MSKGYPRGSSRALSAANSFNPPPAGIVRLRYPIVNQILTVSATGTNTGAAGLQFGLPEGYLTIFSAGAFFQYVTTSANIINATFASTAAIGTVAAVSAAGAMTGTEQNIVAPLAMPAAVAKAVTGARLTGVAIPNVVGGAGVALDNHSKTLSMFLNLSVAGADITDGTTAPFTINGFIDLLLAQMGDN